MHSTKIDADLIHHHAEHHCNNRPKSSIDSEVHTREESSSRMKVWSLLSIGIGGGFGAVARFLVARLMGHWLGGYLPYGTVAVNATGSLILGFLAVFVLDRPEVSAALRLGLAVGFVGAFTTFSTFSYETLLLLLDGAYWRALQNVLGNLVLCLGLCYLGMQLARW